MEGNFILSFDWLERLTFSQIDIESRQVLLDFFFSKTKGQTYNSFT